MKQTAAFVLSTLRRHATPAALCLTAAMFGFIAFIAALALQHIWQMEPCPLCIFQRVALLVSSTALAIAAAGFKVRHGVGRSLSAGAGLLALIGLGIAIKHLHVIWFPQEVSCGPDLEYLMEAFPLAQWIPKVFAGSAECAAAGKQLVLGLAIPVWTALLFTGQVAVAARLAVMKAENPTVGRDSGSS